MANDSKLINATGLWKQKTKDGGTYLAGSMGGVRVLIFPVRDKKSDKSPDYSLVFAPNEPKPDAKTQGEPNEDF
jgi:hypothetical protein